MKVLLVGHSHVVWLEHYLRGAPQNFGLSEVEISYLGVRGGRVATFKNKLDEVARLAPDIIIMHLGGNDLESDRPPQQVGMELYELAKDYKKLGVKHVTVCKIIRRAQWRHLSVNEGNARVIIINEFLSAVCDGYREIYSWRHRGLWQPDNGIFREDGVHLNDLGNYKLYKCMRGAVIRAFRSLT